MIKLTVTDNAINSNITIVNVIFDSTPPEVSITEPEQNSPLKFFENFVRGEVTDDNFDSAQLIVKNGTGVIVSSYNLDITDNKFTKRVEFAPNQSNTLELIAVDKANNSNSTNITVIVGNNTYQNTTDVNESEQVVINATYEAGTEIEFYPNVTTDSVTFTVTAITDETQINILNNSIFTVSGEMAVGKIVEINVTGLDATNESEVQSVTLYLHYTKADLDLNGDGTLGPGDLDEDNLFIYWFNSGNWTKLLKANPDWVIDNGQVKISGDDPGQVWVKVKHLSMFALAALPEPQPTYDGGDDSNGGGGRGGGGASGEENENIECFEIDRQYVSKDSYVSYNFSNECNIIEYINFTALTTSGTVVGKIEMLKNTSTLVDVAPPNMVFKNFNIWVGYAGWATEKNIEDVTITFVVNKSWVQANNIDTDLIALNIYVNSSWIPLQTKQFGENNDVLIYTASTTPDSFGNFAVTGVKIGGEVDVTTTPVVASVATPSEMPPTEPTQKFTYKTWLILGVVLLLLAIGLVYLKKDQISIWLKERRP
jgi:PGF-pre-PGF domain-containing protein